MRCLVLIFVVTALPTFAQQNLAIIKDKDGFTNVRGSANMSASVVGKIMKGELFEYIDTNTAWSKISKPTIQNPIEGYVHKSRIRPLRSLRDSEIQKLIQEIFITELAFIMEKNFGKEYNEHHETKFDFVLSFAADYILETKYQLAMRMFIETVKYNVGSADEHPSDILAYIFSKSPDWTIIQMRAVGLDKMLVERLEFGLSNLTFDKKDKKLQDPLLKKIDGLKKELTD